MTLTGHRPDVGDFSFPNPSRNASSTVSSRSTDQGQSATSVSENSHEGTSDCEAEHDGGSLPPAGTGMQTAEALSQLNKDFNGIVTSSPILQFRHPHKDQGVSPELVEPHALALPHEVCAARSGDEMPPVVGMDLLPAQRKILGHEEANKEVRGGEMLQKKPSQPMDTLDEPLQPERCKENDGSSENSGFSDSDNEHLLQAQNRGMENDVDVLDTDVQELMDELAHVRDAINQFQFPVGVARIRLPEDFPPLLSSEAVANP